MELLSLDDIFKKRILKILDYQQRLTTSVILLQAI